MRTSVIIPVRNDKRILRCVKSVLVSASKIDGPPPQLIVVDNGSEPGFRSCLSQLPAEVELIFDPQPGPFSARNCGIARATGDVVFFTDAPCEVHPGWLGQGLQAFALAGADIIQGHSGSLGSEPIDRFIQARYEARFRGVPAGSPVECDTRNLAVRREVFARLSFNDRWRRVADTEFGLAAEQLGFKVIYWPAMRVDHEHDREMSLFLAKQVSHGWGAQRLVREMPDAAWHGGHARGVGRMARLAMRLPGVRAGTQLLTSLTLATGGALGRRLTQRDGFSLVFTAALDKLALLVGHLLYEAGAEEPLPEALLLRRLPAK